MTEDEPKRQSTGFVLLALVLVFSSHALPFWVFAVVKYSPWSLLVDPIDRFNFEDLVFLVFSVSLIAHDPVGYGLRIGDGMRQKWRWVLLLCAIPVLLTAVIYPLLPIKPFSGYPVGMWLISPIAQDLLFAGFLYRWFSVYFPGTLSETIPANRCIIFTAICFSLWHTPGFGYCTDSFVWFQLVYTFLGACLAGIIRQWTGSIIYIIVVHMLVNCIAVHF